VAGPTQWHDKLNSALAGAPETYMTVGLVLLGTVVILIGLFSTSRVLKAAVLAWVILP
jgi:hypothetical protein